MNPFDLPGPQFLLFYAGLAVFTLVVASRLRRGNESREAPYSDMPWNDPYRIAFLRGGKSELVRVAVVSLVDRGLLAVPHTHIQTTAVGRETEVRKRIERDLLLHCQTLREPKDLFTGDRFDAAAAEYEGELTRMRLLPDAEMKARRRALFLGASAVLLFFSVTKIVIALNRGRMNVGFLILLTIVALALLLKSVNPRLTARGIALLENVQNLFLSLKVRAPQIRPGGASTELVMLAAVYGVGALPRETFVWARQLFPRAVSSTSVTSSCGTSCGSSSGGSGCGGGGCGGGCGGCGG
jgi:uncharacterized protein (TIGR04222 family)